MPAPKSSFLDKVLGRLGRMDADGLQKVVQRLARERTFLQTLFNTIEDGVLVLDGDGRIVYFNQSVSRLLGLQPGVAEGQPIARYLPEVDWEKIISPAPDKTQRILRHELEVTYPRPRFLRLFASPLGLEDGQSTGLALILHDATEARQQTYEAIESERIQALTLLAASVAHEIGNPLNALHIHLQLLERELKNLRRISLEVSPRTRPVSSRSGRAQVLSGTAEMEGSIAKLEKYLGVAKGEITRLDYIVTQFLQAIRPTQPRLQPSSLNETVRETLDLLRPELENRGILVRESTGRALPEAAFDPAQVKQALVNLIKNAMQAMTAGGVLSLESGEADDGVWVSVGDTGGGIPQEQLNRIFEPFFTTKKTGSGLGLMIVQRIMREHGGHIDVESHLGQGTVFRLWLPLHQRRVRLLRASSAPEPEGPAEK